MLPKFIEDSKKIVFDEPTHKYTLNGKQCISATRFIQEFSNPFDPDNSILKRCAEKQGKSETVLKKEWRTKGEKAGEIGSQIHESIEHFIRIRKIKKNKWSPIVKEFSNFKFKGSLFSEVLLFDEALHIDL